jgi:hypothetical protein
MTDDPNADLVEMLRAMRPALGEISDSGVLRVITGWTMRVNPAEFLRILAWANARRDAAVAAYEEQQGAIKSAMVAAFDQMALITDPRDSEIARLRSALKKIYSLQADRCPGDTMEDAYAHLQSIARAALNPQPPEPSR